MERLLVEVSTLRGGEDKHLMPRAAWQEAVRLADDFAFQYGTSHVVAPYEAESFARSLQRALQREKCVRHRADINAILRLCDLRKGLRVVNCTANDSRYQHRQFEAQARGNRAPQYDFEDGGQGGRPPLSISARLFEGLIDLAVKYGFDTRMVSYLRGWVGAKLAKEFGRAIEKGLKATKAASKPDCPYTQPSLLSMPENRKLAEQVAKFCVGCGAAGLNVNRR